MRVRALGPSDAPRAIKVLAEAFFDYPVMRFVLQGSPRPSGEEPTVSEGYERRLRALIGFFAQARLLRDELVLGAGEGGPLTAAALVSRPDGVSPPELGELRVALWEELGPEALERYETFGAACAPFEIDSPHIHLNMIGVRRAAVGRGLGRVVLEDVHRRSAEDPRSRGVSLTTEDEANVALYEHFGYECIGCVEVTTDLTTWGFFRADP